MHMTKLGEIMENAVRLTGMDVSVGMIPPDWKVLAAMTMNAAIRDLAAEKFPMMTRVEFRRYRPEWTGNLGWNRGEQCWYDGEYWELIADVSSGEPGQNPCWKKLDMGEVVAFINWDQPWEPIAMDLGSVDVTRFAYSEDPRYNPRATPLKTVGMSSIGVEIQAPAPKGVFCRFVPEYPKIGFNEWVPGSSHDAGDVVYMSTTKDVYICVENVAAPAEGETDPRTISPDTQGNEYWTPVRIRDEFSCYLVRRVAADLQTESQGKFQTKAEADHEFDRLCERYHEGIGETTVRRGRFR